MIWAAAGRAQAPNKTGASRSADQFFVRRAYSAGVTRQALVKLWIAERLDRAA
jgi:hypothetical protein